MCGHRGAVSLFLGIIGVGVLSLGIVGTASPGAQQKPGAEKEMPAITPTVAGQEMFHSYCASCHGLDGKGNGPTASALKKQPPDLTLLCRKNGGNFPTSVVTSVIEGTDFVTDHGTRDMPVWGNAFRLANRDEAMVKLKIHNLTVYIESIQQK